MLNAGIMANHATVTGLPLASRIIGLTEKGRDDLGWVYRMELDFNVFVASSLGDNRS